MKWLGFLDFWFKKLSLCTGPAPSSHTLKKPERALFPCCSTSAACVNSECCVDQQKQQLRGRLYWFFKLSDQRDFKMRAEVATSLYPFWCFVFYLRPFSCVVTWLGRIKRCDIFRGRCVAGDELWEFKRLTPFLSLPPPRESGCEPSAALLPCPCSAVMGSNPRKLLPQSNAFFPKSFWSWSLSQQWKSNQDPGIDTSSFSSSRLPL